MCKRRPTLLSQLGWAEKDRKYDKALITQNIFIYKKGSNSLS
jgi:hypothetical protein